MKSLTRALLPKHQQALVTDEMLEVINSEPDEDLRKIYRDNFLQFIDVLKGGERLSVKNYAYAVKYCSLRLMGDTTYEAWVKTFPEKFERCMQEGKSVGHCQSYAISYNRGKVITRIMERSLIPVHILNMDLHQEAINTQAHLMRTAKSENVRMKAAECLIMHLKAPEEQKINIEVEHKSQALEDLKRVTRDLALRQREAIQDGRVHVKEIAESELFREDASSGRGGFPRSEAESEIIEVQPEDRPN